MALANRAARAAAKLSRSRRPGGAYRLRITHPESQHGHQDLNEGLKAHSHNEAITVPAIYFKLRDGWLHPAAAHGAGRRGGCGFAADDGTARCHGCAKRIGNRRARLEPVRFFHRTIGFRVGIRGHFVVAQNLDESFAKRLESDAGGDEVPGLCQSLSFLTEFTWEHFIAPGRLTKSGRGGGNPFHRISCQRIVNLKIRCHHRLNWCRHTGVSGMNKGHHGDKKYQTRCKG